MAEHKEPENGGTLPRLCRDAATGWLGQMVKPGLPEHGAIRLRFFALRMAKSGDGQRIGREGAQRQDKQRES